MLPHPADWKVLLIGGSSGVGKTTIAREIGLHCGISWIQVDDLRLAFQRSHVTFPAGTSALYFFTETPDIWSKSPELLRDGLIAAGQVLSPALEVLIENHVDTFAPIVIEGDATLPSLFARPSVRTRTIDGSVRAVFLVEPDEEMLLANIMARRRGIAEYTEAELYTQARTAWLYGQWLADEAQRFRLSVVESRPRPTLVERIMAEVYPSRL
jgi:2-phosphoglycerate kinase